MPLKTSSGRSNNDYDPAKTQCVWADDELITRLLERIDYDDKTMPNVPPEEQLYLEAESAAARQAYEEEKTNGNNSHGRSSQMYTNLHSRPLFTVWEFRKQIEPARSALKRILKRQPNLEKGDLDFIIYNKNPEAEKLQRANNANYAIGLYTKELNNFFLKIEGRELSFFTNSQYMRVVSDTLMNYELQRFISCKLAKVMGRQSFGLN